jgi:hypothetical protein
MRCSGPAATHMQDILPLNDNRPAKRPKLFDLNSPNYI